MSEETLPDREFALAAACAIASDEELAHAASRLAGGAFDWDRFLALVRYHLSASLALDIPSVKGQWACAYVSTG